MKENQEFSKTEKKVLIFSWKFCWFLKLKDIDEKIKMDTTHPEIDKKNTNSMNLLTMCDLFIG